MPEAFATCGIPAGKQCCQVARLCAVADLLEVPEDFSSLGRLRSIPAKVDNVESNGGVAFGRFVEGRRRQICQTFLEGSDASYEMLVNQSSKEFEPAKRGGKAISKWVLM
jgi:hypothetical protein